jgi:hypothetical protein
MLAMYAVSYIAIEMVADRWMDTGGIIVGYVVGRWL